jgi:hypothetical protein
MVILVRKEVNGNVIPTFPSVANVTTQQIIQAELQDKKIKEKICSIEDNARKKNLLQLKGGKKDIVKLYHYVGSQLKPFLNSLKLTESEKQHFWREINFHSNELKMTGTNEEEGPVRLEGLAHRSAWWRMVKIADWSEEDALELNWDMWSALFDTTLSRRDGRIIDWIISTKREKYDKEKDGSLQAWLRTLRKAVTRRISKETKIDTTYLDDDELKAELDAALATAESDFESARDEIAKKKTTSKKPSPKKKTSDAKKKKVSGKGKQTR